ncbi:MAG: glycosyltransferase [Saprospiraceae bacterium]|nr:glycosyltransferase [Saprospiraceae bacterium]
MTLILYILTVIVFFFLTFPFWTVLLSLFAKEKIGMPITKSYDFGCIITAYRNANIAKGLVKSLANQTHQNLHIYLVADACDISDFNLLHEKFTLLKPSTDLNLKVKSIIYGTENFVRSHDFIAIFDADNITHPELLSELNRYANQGYVAIQGQRTAKNTDTNMAAADSLGELYKNYIERYIPYLLGSSSVISGSGMAVESQLYKAYLLSPEIEQGKHLWKKMLQEDKILQNFLLSQNIKIAYAKNAITYDEKVTTADAVETQRSRWLFSYFQNIPNSLGILRRGIFNISLNQFYFGLITISPPLFILLGCAILLALLGLILSQWWVCGSIVIGIIIFVFTILWTLYLSDAPKSVWQSIISGVPTFIIRQMRAMFKIGNPNKNFTHTEHKVDISIDEILKK